MTSKIPAYLKIHADSGCVDEQQPDELVVLSSVLEKALGWRVQLNQSRDHDGQPLELTTSFTGAPPVEQQVASELIAALNVVCGELRETRRALWQREAELAAAVPVTPRPDEESHLAERLQAILQAGAQAVGAQAASLYLLNDDTTELKTRACWGLPHQRLLDPPRALRGSVADLEALVGHAVVLEDTEVLSHWRVPEAGFPSAVCVPVSSPTSPLGTLWVFSAEPRDFTPEQTNMIEIIAGRIAADLDREVLLHEGVASKDLKRQCDIVASSQVERLPHLPPLIDNWEVAGWTTPSSDLLTDFYDWCVLPDGQLALAIGDAMGKGLEGALTAANLQTALKAHGSYRHDARQMVSRLNDTLWTASAGDQFASLFYCLIDPESGSLQFSTSGKVGAALSHSAEPFFGNSVPLGTQPEDTFRLLTNHLGQGDSMLMFSEGLLPLAKPSGRRRGALLQLLEDARGRKA
ncbi:MAG: SpoIIE family protein phosphatase, partial [Planctomycetales bacterium]|nr:SpoIIE family protein phosphatase [Planctomycetales bacterium]